MLTVKISWNNISILKNWSYYECGYVIKNSFLAFCHNSFDCVVYEMLFRSRLNCVNESCHHRIWQLPCNQQNVCGVVGKVQGLAWNQVESVTRVVHLGQVGNSCSCVKYGSHLYNIHMEALLPVDVVSVQAYCWRCCIFTSLLVHQNSRNKKLLRRFLRPQRDFSFLFFFRVIIVQLHGIQTSFPQGTALFCEACIFEHSNRNTVASKITYFLSYYYQEHRNCEFRIHIG